MMCMVAIKCHRCPTFIGCREPKGHPDPSEPTHLALCPNCGAVVRSFTEAFVPYGIVVR